MGNSQSRQRAALVQAIREDAASDVAQLLDRCPQLLGLKLDARTGDLALHAAVQARAHAVLRLLLKPSRPQSAALAAAVKAGVDRTRGSDGWTPLMLACHNGEEEAVELLLHAGADPWAQERCLYTPIHLAALNNQPGAIRALVQHVQDQAVQGEGQAVQGSVSATAPGQQDVPALTRPSLARVSAAVKQVVQHIISQDHSKRPLVDATARHNITPLMLAAADNRTEAAAELLRLGAAFKPRCWWTGAFPDGSSALHIAALNDHQQVAWAIVSAYAVSRTPEQQSAPAQVQRALLDGSPMDPRLLQDDAGLTPFALARSLRHFSVINLLNPVTPISLLMDCATPEDRAVGAPRLLQIAGKVAQQQLLHQVKALARSLRGAQGHGSQPGAAAGAAAAAGKLGVAAPAAAGAPRQLQGSWPRRRLRLRRLPSFREGELAPGAGRGREGQRGGQGPAAAAAGAAAGAEAAAEAQEAAALYHRLLHGISSPCLELEPGAPCTHQLPPTRGGAGGQPALPRAEQQKSDTRSHTLGHTFGRTSTPTAAAPWASPQLPDEPEAPGRPRTPPPGALPPLQPPARGPPPCGPPQLEELLGLGASSAAGEVLSAGAEMVVGALAVAAPPPWTCEVCANSNECVAMQPCGHLICVSCAEELIKLHSYEVLPCPFCRGGIRGFVQAPTP